MIDFNKDYILENETVLLRPLLIEDFQYLKHFAINEPDLWKYSLQRGDGLVNFEKYILTAIDGRKQQNQYPFIVFDKRSNQYAGSTRFYDIQNKHQTTQLGFTWYGEEFQGTGLNKNCKFLMLQLAFEQLNMTRVEFRANTENIRSISAMKSIGCKEEGVLRNHLVAENGERRSSIVLSILVEEWHNEIKEKVVKMLPPF